ncbi:MAG: amino acid ABC transporter ATP-binding protein [Lentisphaeria bacterium]|jgi:polar amino acid transport system ATP-binding protein|nr:amino acid ABC transporter ATP-binding protein [Lentisphaeria bacterium]
MSNSNFVFEVRNLVCEFPGVRAVDNVDFAITPGEAVFVVGPSGSGKSTFLRCLNLLEKSSSGEILFHNAPVGKNASSVTRFRQKVGMVFQHFNLFPNLTIKKNITLAPVKTGKLTPAQADAKAMALLERIGLADKANAYPMQLSGGQKQRIAIVRALAMEPEVLLFDEPTSALDPEMVGEVLSLMKELIREGMTMIVVTHEIGFACECAQRMIFMDHGRIIASETPENLVNNSTNPRIREFFAKVL